MPFWKKKKPVSAVDSGSSSASPSVGSVCSEERNNNRVTTVMQDTAHVVSIVIDDDQKRVTDEELKQRLHRELTKFLSPLYAIIIVIIGFLFPLTEALESKWLQTEYYAAFMTYILCLSIALLVYFIIYLMRQSKTSKHVEVKDEKERKRELDENSNAKDAQRTNETHKDRQADNETSRDKRPVVLEEEGASKPKDRKRKTSGSGRWVPKLRSTKSCASLGSIESDTVYVDDRQQMAQNYTSRYNSINRGAAGGGVTGHLSPVSAYISASVGDLRKQRPLNQCSETLMASMANLNVIGDDDSEDGLERWIDLTKLGNIFSHEGSSLYLRFATLLFGVCNVIYVGLEIENTMVKKSGCNNIIDFGWVFIIRLIFLVVQTFFLFKYPMVEIKQSKSIARFGLMHIMATNICVWLKTLVFEITSEFSHLPSSESNETSAGSQHTYVETTTPSPTYTVCDYYTGALRTLSPYLFPFVLEYSLIAMGTLATMYVSIVEGSNDSNSIARGLHNLFKIHVPTRDVGEKGGSGGHEAEDAVLRKSHRGLFLGVLVLSGAVITIVMFYASTDAFTKNLMYLSTDLCVHSFLIVATILAIASTNQLSYIAKPLMVDDILLILAMIGSFLYEFSYMMSTCNYIRYHPSDKQETMEILQLCSSLAASIQTLLQVVLVASGLRRYPSKRKHLDSMPGRGSITFLIVVNVVVWICRTMQAKQIPQYTEFEYYGEITWLLLININLPLLLFFRYHSSICLADIWHIAYYPVDAKLQKMNVQVGEGNRLADSTPKTAALVRIPSRDRLHSNVITSLSRASSMCLDSPEANGDATMRQKPRSKMLEGIEIIPEDGVLYQETMEEDEAYGSSL